jgi:hypothetical protein
MIDTLANPAVTAQSMVAMRGIIDGDFPRCGVAD